MVKIKKEKEEEMKKALEIFDDEQSDEFDKELEPYRCNAKINGESIRILTLGGELAYLRDKKLIKVGGELTRKMNCDSECPPWKIYINKVVDYQEFENKMKALKIKKGKGEFVKMMDLKRLDEVAKQMPESPNFLREDDNEINKE